MIIKLAKKETHKIEFDGNRKTKEDLDNSYSIYQLTSSACVHYWIIYTHVTTSIHTKYSVFLVGGRLSVLLNSGLHFNSPPLSHSIFDFPIKIKIILNV